MPYLHSIYQSGIMKPRFIIPLFCLVCDQFKRMHRLIQITLLTLFIFFSSAVHAATIYVDTDATSGLNNGSSWANAYTTLQPALNVASAGDSIWIAAGTYNPTHLPSTGDTSTTSRDVSFYLDTDIEIYGGFVGTETAISQRNSTSNPVILSGDINAGGTATNDCYHVFITDGLSSAAVLDGVTITGGKANGSSRITYSGQNYDRHHGGGMYNRSSSPTLTDVTISGNTASHGGGMYSMSSSPTLTDVTISGNTASYGGIGCIYR